MKSSNNLLTIAMAIFLLIGSSAAASSGGINAPGSGTASGKWRSAQASFYGQGTFRGYCGDRFVSEQALVFAHQSLPCGQRVQFRRPGGRQVFVARVVDRGPFVAGRQFDLSWRLAQKLGLLNKGVGPVHYRVLR